ncbi:hypothetical protein F9L16_23710 [Agarivorans sp. B2Z047]|uniref:hypothetical protein n=1 Tax=Agarivorans sp. B2Z047 TaxID=2652721 RepID=UPI00128AE77A|nr:hypothetical protein [Agarivorans sp. B2Z047]MPW31962.1 hypothetical protein [Agarivorans sp. B2Z047]UQN41975.1 hypothetical protein LQZ07_19705 [Agarivorans sp. B2Z047]
MGRKHIHINTLVNEYMEVSKSINRSHEKLISCSRGFWGRKIRPKLQAAREEHKEYCVKLEELDEGFVGDLEIYAHENLAHLSIKDINYKVLSRARKVCVSNLERFEKSFIAIEDSRNFKTSMKVAWSSIGVAIISIIANFLSS